MKEYKTTARAICILFIVASVTAIVGGSLASLPLEESDYLTEVADKDALIVTGVLLLMVQTIAVIGIAVMFFPVLDISISTLTVMAFILPLAITCLLDSGNWS